MDSSGEWNLCCSRTKRSLFVYLTQVITIWLTMIFCMVQIANSQEEERYIGILLFCLGLVFPSPAIKQAKMPQKPRVIVDETT